MDGRGEYAEFKCQQSSICGNGILEAGEECDNGNNNDDALPGYCRKNCRKPYCGDGVVENYTTLEQCDDRNNMSGDGCSATCQKEAAPSTITPLLKPYCCIDNRFGIVGFTDRGQNFCGGNPSIEATDENFCRTEAASRNYRFSPLYASTGEFALVCTEATLTSKTKPLVTDIIPCGMNDPDFFYASFEGHKLGFAALKNAIGILPALPIEYHISKDSSCFSSGYGNNPLATNFKTGNAYSMCNIDYFQYQKIQGTIDEKPLQYYRELESQTLTIHEPIHAFFQDYSGCPLEGTCFGPSYFVQESFCKAISLLEVGLINNYGDAMLSGMHTLKNPPTLENDYSSYVNFFVYSLYERFGITPQQIKEFFIRFASGSHNDSVGDMRVKLILDDILGVDTKPSFDDLKLLQ